MGSVRFKLGIQSSNTVSDKLDFSVEKVLSVIKPYGSLARAEVGHATATTFFSTGNPDSMLYVKNLDTTNFINVTNSADEIVSKVPPGMFVLIGVPATAGVKMQADTAAVEIEYGYWSL